MTVMQSGGIASKTCVTRIRYQPGVYYDGWYHQAAPVETQIRASVQPPNRMGSARTIQDVIGQRFSEIVCIITQPNTLRVADEQNRISADRIIYNGKEYEVKHINSWITGQVNMHDTAYAVRVDASNTDTSIEGMP